MLDSQRNEDLDILIVDDLEDNRTLLRLDIEDEIPGTRITEAVGGETALSILEIQDFSVVICDLMMPDIDGFTLYELYKKRLPKRVTPFIFLSANKQKESAEKGIKLGAFDYITKPYDLNELIGKIRNLARLKSLTDSLLATQTELIESNQSLKNYIREKDEYLGMIGHDLKTPVMSIMGLSEELLESNGENGEIKSILEAIRNSANEIGFMSKKITGVTTDDGGIFSLSESEVDVNQLIDEVLMAYIILAKQKGIEVAISYIQNSPIFWMDRDKLRQCVSNLFYNAVKFTPKHGCIGVKASYKDDCLVISVEDSGIGIPEEMRSELFIKYSPAQRVGTENEKGSGLGLSIVKRYTEMMGGTVQLTSELGKGSNFTLVFDHIKTI